jgi:TctA family transporter
MQEVMAAWALGLDQVLTVAAMGALATGVAIGFFVGLLPGLGGPAALALMLPFVFGMETTEAFAFLLGMLSVTATMGDVTSILFGVPGEATTAATIVDGHAMTRRGEAGMALGGVLTSSVVGGVLGSILLAVAIPVIRPLVLSIGPPEMLMLAVCGMTLVAALSAGRFVQGLIAACLGLLLGTIGLDPHGSVERYTFGQLFLWDGLGLVPVTIGLFAIPEMVELASNGGTLVQSDKTGTRGVSLGIRRALQRWRLVLRCGAIGSLIGALPGVGGSVSQWVAYAHAVQGRGAGPRPGEGCFEGVLGPGAANNATLGGALLPTVAFGVPGSLSTAILLGAFLIQGLVPGPSMLIPDADGGRLSLTFSMVWMIALANLIGVAVCFIALPKLVHITRVRSDILVPFIMLLAYLGAFAERNAVEDMALMVAIGMLGLAMKRLHWPRTPLLLGLILGPIAEENLMLSLELHGLDWLTRPAVIGIAAATLGLIAYSMHSLAPTTDRSRYPIRQPHETGRREPLEAGRPLDLAAGVFASALFIYAGWTGQGFQGKASVLPSLAALAGLLVSLGHLWSILRAHGHRHDFADRPAAGFRRWWKGGTLVSVGWVIAFYGLISLLGIALGGTLGLFLYLRFQSAVDWPRSLVLPGLVFGFLHGVFGKLLHLPLPAGLLN